MSAADIDHMSRAIVLARRGLYTTDPNPRVGCVIVREGRVVGEGWHEEAGRPHAEIHALRSAGAEARGATAYVSLEPCCHHGQTDPCTDALIEAGIARVVVAMRDPNPLVDGRGLAALESAGVSVEVGPLERTARELNCGFDSRMRRGRPYVRCKLAMSLDARTAMASGESKWITSPAARRDGQRLRARSSAIVTGIGTVLADDPALSIRPAELELPVGGPGAVRHPLRVVVDSRLRTPTSAQMLALPGDTLVLGARTDSRATAALESAGAEVISLPGTNAQVDLHRAAHLLAERGVNEVLLECGPRLAGAMLAAGLLDELVLHVAPVLLGDGARGLIRIPGLTRLAERTQLEIREIRALGEDWRIVATPRTGEPGPTSA